MGLLFLKSEASCIRARGVRVHNLQNVDVDVPHGELVAVCGVSGSGKTSLAIDTLYAEGQRRYIESFSAYTRQFLERLQKPDFDSIEGLPPALAVTRGSSPRGNRSTVGTASETLDYLRLLFANVSTLVCHSCGESIQSYTPQSVALEIQSWEPGQKLMLGVRLEWEDVGDRSAVLADLQNQGFVRLVSGSRVLHLGQDARESLAESLPEKTDETQRVWMVVDRLKSGDEPARTTPSLETAFDFGFGLAQVFQAGAGDSFQGEKLVIDAQEWAVHTFPMGYRCVTCGIDYPSPQTRLFSFNSPLGACSKCEGFGDTVDLDQDLLFPDKSLSIQEGAIAPWNSPAYEHHLDELLDLAGDLELPVDVPFKKLKKAQVRLLIEGSEDQGFGGLNGFFAGLERKKYKMHVRVFLSRWRSYRRCTQCGGQRLNPLALSYRLAGYTIADMCAMQVEQLIGSLEKLAGQLSDREQSIAKNPLEQVLGRLKFLQLVGLGYLQLDRTLRTLSGGEAQRTALTGALASNLVNMLYVLDEPSVGLHPHDVEQLSVAIQRLAQRGNTVLMVEHEEALLSKAQRLIEIGPGAGSEGGRVVYNGSVEGEQKGSLTLDYLAGRRVIAVPEARRNGSRSIQLKGCSGHNLKQIDVQFPLNALCVVTGVSGSGKSTLVQETLFPAMQRRLGVAKVEKALPFKSIVGSGQVQDCILIDQSPASRSPRSNPVTFVKAFDEIRQAFAGTTEAVARNLSAGHFSFNSELGRCPECSGDGHLSIDMQFLADVTMDCPTCRGARYRSEILSVRYRELSIAEVLRLTVAEAIQFFRGAAKVQQKLKVLKDVGLSYVQLGQSATTLSSGEAQRLKLAGFLASASRKHTLFILDEPTTGLHMQDITKLLACLDTLLEDGHSLIVVEHNVHIMAAADYIIDLGPGPADQGGEVVAAGTPEEITQVEGSTTARYLRSVLDANRS